MRRSNSGEQVHGQMGAVSQQLSALKRAFSGGTAGASFASIPSLSLVSSEACTSPDRHRRMMTMDRFQESRSENGSCRDTWTAEHTRDRDSAQQTQDTNRTSAGDDGEPLEQTVVRRVAKSDRIILKDVVCDAIDIVSERMREQPDELSEDLKTELRDILHAAGDMHHREELGLLQTLLMSRTDLTPDVLAQANRTQLELLVAIKTGIQAFLHPDISVTQSMLTEVLISKRCRNLACQSILPGDDCSCELCSSNAGFCNACMCTICNKFDFDVNTCRWIGCDSCAHWMHTDCALRLGHIAVGPSKSAHGASETLVRCKACQYTSSLLGWVKDAFLSCASNWERDELVREFDCVRIIFRGSEDARGKRLYWKAEDLLDKLKTGVDVNIVCKEIQRLFRDLEAEDNGKDGEGFRAVEPQEACTRIVELVKEALAKMEAVAEEKARSVKKARLALETADIELEDKKKELGEIEMERQQKQLEIEELETIVRLKQAEGEMFQMRSDEARQEAESMQRLAIAKSDKFKEDYANRYLKLRLNEAEAERRSLFEKMQQQDHHFVPSLTMAKIQDVVKQAYASAQS